MNGFESLLSTDYGFKPQPKSAPMAPPIPTTNNSNFPPFNFHSNPNPNPNPNLGGFSDSTSLPLFDKPLYDDEGFSAGKYDDIFSSNSRKNDDGFDDILGGLAQKESMGSVPKRPMKGGSGFDDLLPGFGRGASLNRKDSDAAKKTSNTTNDPFVVLESTSNRAPSSSAAFNDPLEEAGHRNNSDKRRAESNTRGVFDDVDPLDGFGKSVPVFSANLSGSQKDASPLKAGPRSFERKLSENGDVTKKSSRRMPVNDYRESPQNVFGMPSVSSDSSPAHRNSGYKEPNSYARAGENVESSDDIWLTVSEVPLFTQPTAAPPPSRPPPPRHPRFSKVESRSFPASKKSSEHSSSINFQSRKPEPSGVRGSFASPIDELENFATGRNSSDVGVSSPDEDHETNSVAAAEAMKEAMARAEAKFRHARGAKDQERLERERLQREKDEEERRRVVEREREEKEREKRRIERERELARQAVDRAAREARERAAAEARARAERAAVQKAQAEARVRAERAAVQRVQAEARDRAAAEAKERTEKAAAEARERARIDKEARERAARENQQKNENDLESFFGAGPRASSAPRPRASSSDSTTANFQSKPAAETTRTSMNSSSNLRKASPSTNIVDDLSSIFGGPPSSEEFQEVGGESEERRRARLERHQRTQERAAKALAEKNARDLEVQREQAERHRIGETLDVEIKRWAAGKEGNLRALLSTLQYVLWPECGWQPVSLTDLITAAAVKKVYRKATLCIHPDKVQQKGANLQQKYIAEKVFDILKEAWNKFNSEELF